MKLSLIISAVDKASSNIGKIGTATKRLLGRTGLAGLGKEAKEAGKGVDVLGNAATKTPGRLRLLLGNVRRLAGRAGMRGLEISAYAAGTAIGTTIRLVGGLAAKLAMGGALAASAGAGFFLGGIISLGSKFEQFQVVLEKTEGSAEGARKAMAWVRDFAKTTPYEVEQVMEAFVRLRAYGIDPMGGALTGLGNASSGMSKELMAAVEMLADAQTGEFERLKEFGVRAKVAGKNVTFSYMRAGKEVTRTAKNSGAAIQKAIIGIFDESFGGMMDRQSRTLSGLWSNLKDTIAGFQLDVANAGIFDFLKGKLQSLLDKVNELAANGKLQEWAEKLSAWLEKMGAKAFDFVENTDWEAVARDVKTIAEAAWDLASALAAIVRFMNQLPTFGMPDWWTANGKGWPRELVDRFNARRDARDEQQETTQRNAGKGLTMPTGWSLRGNKPAPALGPAWNRPAAPQLGPAWNRPRSGAPFKTSSVDVGGRVIVDLRTPAGVTASVRSARSENRNVPLVIERGRVGAGAGI